jgi:hypothetical protein
MRQLSTISVQVPEKLLEFFVANATENAASSWRRNPEAEAELASFGGSRQYCFFPLQRPGLEFYFYYVDGVLKLGACVPRDNAATSPAEHARYVSALWETAISPACEAFDLRATYAPMRNVKPEEGLPPAVADALLLFAGGANKEEGNYHPSDMEAWCHFLLLKHITGAEMDEERLSEYLTKKKFREKTVARLVHQAEMARELLETYDRYLAERDRLRASEATVQ